MERFGVVAPAPASAQQDTLAWRRERAKRRLLAERGPFRGRGIGRALRDALEQASKAS